ncbi:hypothetical protein ABZ953_05435 [Streptomyces sp. NPDC046465]|uniref:hypothetical protein n=1 Tax=Streptomyces sp. NPDC046465 TaxID=3155810 RepID=UPI0033D29F5F
MPDPYLPGPDEDRTRTGRGLDEDQTGPEFEAKICFGEGSWCRLAPPTERIHCTVLRHLAHPTVLLPVSEMSPRQRKHVESYSASLSERAPSAAPVVTQRPSGRFLIEVRTKEPVSANRGIATDYWFMSRRGGRGATRPNDL